MVTIWMKNILIIKKKFKNDIFTGFLQNNPTDLMQISDCVVMATRNETLEWYLLKQWMWCLCLGSDSGGPLESIEWKQVCTFKTMDSDDLYKNSWLLKYSEKDFSKKWKKNLINFLTVKFSLIF